MARNTFAFFGILAVLLLGIGMVSAAVDSFELTIVGDGISASRLTGINNSAQAFTINVNNTNTTFGNVYINWSVASTTIMTLPAGEVINVSTDKDITGFVLTMPYASSSYKQLKANIYTEDMSTFLGEENINIYFNNTDYVTSAAIPGCTDSSATNYDASATTDDGSCTYPSTPDYTFCKMEGYEDQGDLKISDFEVNNLGEGKDEEWQFLDEIEIMVEIENTNNNDDVDDVEVELRIYDRKITSSMSDISDYDFTDDFDLDDEISSDIGTLKDDDEETLTFTINEVPSDLDDGTYYLYLRAYEDGNEANQCRSESNKIDDDYYFQFSIESVDNDEAVVARNVGLDSIVDTYCNQKNLEISVPIYNLGDNDEEKVLVNIFNSEMGINEIAIIDDLDSGDDETAIFFVNIPSSLSKDKYDLDITVYFDWDDDEEENDFSAYDEETSDEMIRLNIISCKGPEPTIKASLESTAEIGTDLVIKTMITNNGEDNDFLISVSDFESWADLVSVVPQTVSIDNGEFTEVTITLNPKVAGAQSFKINTMVDGESNDQLVSVSIDEKPGLFGEMNDVLTYTIIGIIALIVLIFLVLIARASRRPAKPQF